MKKQKAANLLLKNKEFLITLLFCPFIWVFILRPHAFIDQWRQFFSFSKTNISQTFTGTDLTKIEELRWYSFGHARGSFLGRIFYNKGRILLTRAFEYLVLLAPRFYFQSGDGSAFSFANIEPIPLILFVPWVLGLLQLIDQKKWRPLLIWFFSPILAFLSGQRNFAYLLPTAIINVYISTLILKNKPKIILIICTYSLFLFIRFLLYK